MTPRTMLLSGLAALGLFAVAPAARADHFGPPAVSGYPGYPAYRPPVVPRPVYPSYPSYRPPFPGPGRIDIDYAVYYRDCGRWRLYGRYETQRAARQVARYLEASGYSTDVVAKY